MSCFSELCRDSYLETVRAKLGENVERYRVDAQERRRERRWEKKKRGDDEGTRGNAVRPWECY